MHGEAQKPILRTSVKWDQGNNNNHNEKRCGHTTDYYRTEEYFSPEK